MKRPLIVMMIVFCSACSGKQPIIKTRPHVPGKETNASRAITHDVQQQMKERRVLRAFATATWRSSGSVRVSDIALLLQLPRLLSAEALDDVAGVWGKFTAEEKSISFEVMTRRGERRGEISKRAFTKLFDFQWENEELIALLAGSVPFLESDMLVQGSEEHFYLKDHPFLITVDKKGRLLSLVRRDELRNISLYEVRFSDYRKQGKYFFPYRIEISIKPENKSLLVEYHEVTFEKM